MIEIEQTRDVVFLDRCFREWAWKAMQFDGCVAREKVTNAPAVGHPNHVFIKVSVDGAEAGFCHLVLCEPGVIEPHLTLSPAHRGPVALETIQTLRQWIRARFGAVILRVRLPDFLRGPAMMLTASGWKRVGASESNLRRGGKQIKFYHYERYA